MAVLRKYLPSFAGGEEVAYDILHREDGEIVDLTGYTISAEIVWEDCAQIEFSVGNGISNFDPTPATTDDAHYTLTLTEEQTETIPIGTAMLKLIRLSPGGVTTIDGPILLERRI